MKCSIDSTGLCASHGVQMHPDFGDMTGSVCPVGHVVEIERRFKHEMDDARQQVRNLLAVCHELTTRIDVVEGLLGIDRDVYREEDLE